MTIGPAAARSPAQIHCPGLSADGGVSTELEAAAPHTGSERDKGATKAVNVAAPAVCSQRRRGKLRWFLPGFFIRYTLRRPGAGLWVDGTGPTLTRVHPDPAPAADKLDSTAAPSQLRRHRPNQVHMNDTTLAPREKRKRRIALLAALFALVGVTLPMGMATYFAAHNAHETQALRLELHARKVAERATIALVQARSALDALDALDGPDEAACSAQHVELMRRFTLNTLSVEEIEYDDGVSQCSTWQQAHVAIERKPDFGLGDGIEGFTGLRSHITGSDPMLGLRRGSYLVMINVARFTDISVPQDVGLAFMHLKMGMLSASRSLSPEDAELLQSGAFRNASGDRFVSEIRWDDWVALATGPEASSEDLAHQIELLVPLGLLAAAIVIGLIVQLSRKRLSPVAELRIGIRKREFILHYQPIIELASGKLVGAEALVRWQRPDGVLVRPDLFIDLAEEHQLITAVTEQVFDILIRDLKDFLHQHPDFHVSVNLSAQDIGSASTMKLLRERLDNAGIRAQQIWLEVTERGCVANGAEASEQLELARDAGHFLAIDDFGTGYCGLQYLQTLPLDILKIDKSFVQTVATESVTGPVLAHIISLAKSLDLAIVAEGVETEQQAQYLQAHGVQYAQGWLFSKPLTLNQLNAFSADHGL